MYQAFSKGFGKKGSDLLKKDFKDKYTGKVTTRAKAADGSTFEANFSDKDNKKKDATVSKYDDADFTVTVPVDDTLKIELKAKANKDTSLKMEAKVDDNLTANFTLENASIGDNMPGNVKFGGTYATGDFSAELEGLICKGGTVKGNAGAALGFAAPVPGVDGLSFGLKPAVTQVAGAGDAMTTLFNVSANVAYEQKDYQIGLNTFSTTTPGDFTFGGAEFVGWAKVNGDLQIAAKIAQFNATAPKPAVAWTAATMEDTSEFSIGTQYSLSKTQTAKTKLTTTQKFDKIQCDFALKTALEGKSSLGLAVNLDSTLKAPTFGLTYTLE